MLLYSFRLTPDYQVKISIFQSFSACPSFARHYLISTIQVYPETVCLSHKVCKWSKCVQTIFVRKEQLTAVSNKVRYYAVEAIFITWPVSYTLEKYSPCHIDDKG